MADSHRPVSRYKDNFTAGSSSNDVYDQYARPANVQQERIEEGTSRPRTSRGRHSFGHHQSFDSVTNSTTSVQLTEGRPKTSRGRRQSGPGHYFESEAPADPSHYSNERLVISPDEVSKHSKHSEGYRRHSDNSQDGTDCARPRTSRGRRMSEGPSVVAASHVQDSSVDVSRPKTSKGRRSTITGDTPNYPSSRSSNVNVLNMDPSLRPRTGKRRSSMGPTVGPTPSPDYIERTYGSRAAQHAVVDVGDLDPSPPDYPSPRRQRPKSKYKNRSERSYSQDSVTYFDPGDIIPSESRPGTSNLNRFTPLPSIGGKSSGGQYMSNTDMAAAVNRLQLSDSGNLSRSHGHGQFTVRNRPRSHYEINRECNVPDTNDNSVQPSEDKPGTTKEQEDSLFQTLQREITLPPEVTVGDRLMLAIKLPSGQRVQRAFPPDDRLGAVIEFAEHSAQLDFTGCELVCVTSGPRQVFKDLSKTLQESGVQDRTVLHIQMPDDA